MKPSDVEKLELEALARGDSDAFDSIYHRYHQSIYANIFRIVRRSDHAEDILQDVFVTLWQYRHNLNQDRPVAGWLFVVSYNKSLTFLRQQLRVAVQYIDDIDYHGTHTTH
ncbi:MAG TPA: sigma factor [Sphingobacteriaceae bacterium]|nr:sigma factor [Sphingobacteriaceae bacterium]